MVVLRNATFVIVVNSRHAENHPPWTAQTSSKSSNPAVNREHKPSEPKFQNLLVSHRPISGSIRSRGSTGGGRIVEIQRFSRRGLASSALPVILKSSLYVLDSTAVKRIDEVIERIHIISELDRRVERANTKSQKEEMSGVGFLAAVKTFTPGGRRRRRCEKQQKVLELPPGYAMQPDVVPCWDAAPPITPPAAFLPPGYKKGFPGELIFAFASWEEVVRWRERFRSRLP